MYQYTGDSSGNEIYFDSCNNPFAVHKNSVSADDSLAISDTIITPCIWQDSCNCITVTSTASNNCFKKRHWSFVLADNIGPTRITLSNCSEIVGASYSESRALLSYFIPTSISSYAANAKSAADMTVKQYNGQIACFLPYRYKAYVGLYTLSGRELMHKSAISGQVEFPTASLHSGVYIVRAKNNGKEYCGKILLKN